MQYILSSQGIRIHQEPASFAARLAAFSIDFMLMGIAWLFLLLILKEGAFEGINGALVITLVILIPYLYPLISETVASGQTLGKKLLHIRVVDLEGGGPKISAFILRWLILPLDGHLPRSSYLHLLNHQEAQQGIVKRNHITFRAVSSSEEAARFHF